MKKKLFGMLAMAIAFSIGLTRVFATTDMLQVSSNKYVRYLGPVDKNTIDVGDEICIGTECFYVLSTDDSNTTLIAKYNLLVGNKSTASLVIDEIAYDVKSLGDEETKIQDEKAIGADYGEGIFYGTVKHDDDLITNYLGAYEVYFEENYGLTFDMRIPNSNDVHYIGCDKGEACNSSEVPEWAKNTTYWINVPGFSDGIVIVRGVPDNGVQRDFFPETSEGIAGIRPVMDVQTSFLKKNTVKIDSSDDSKGSEYLTQTDEEIIVNVEVKAGYDVDKVTAKDSEGNNITVTEKDGKYTIDKSLIKGDVTIKITYKEKVPTAILDEEENPDTLDNITLIIALFSISIFGLATSLYFRKRNN